MKTGIAVAGGLLALAMLLFGASQAAAADAAAKVVAQDGCDAQTKCWKVVENGKEVVKCGLTKVCGKRHAPQAVFVLPRATPPTAGPDFSESFIPKIIKSVREEPF